MGPDLDSPLSSCAQTMEGIGVTKARSSCQTLGFFAQGAGTADEPVASKLKENRLRLEFHPSGVRVQILCKGRTSPVTSTSLRIRSNGHPRYHRNDVITSNYNLRSATSQANEAIMQAHWGHGQPFIFNNVHLLQSSVHQVDCQDGVPAHQP